MLTQKVNGIMAQGADDAVISIALNDVNNELECAIGALNENVCEEAITSFSNFLDASNDTDEVERGYASAAIMKLYTNARLAQKCIKDIYKYLNGKEVEL